MRTGKGVPIMAILVLLACIVSGASSAPCAARAGAQDAGAAPGQGLVALFGRANESYSQGDYEGAVEKYLALVRAGVRDPDLFYNLANAYYRMGETGEAVLYYERALRLDPRDADTRKNLELVRSLLRDKQFVREDSWIERPYRALERNLSVDEALGLTSLLYLVLSILLVGYVFFDSRPVSLLHSFFYRISPGRLLGLSPRGDYVLVTAAALVLWLLVGSIAARELVETRARRSAVVLEREVPVYSEPSADSTLQFKIHEGTLVRIEENRRGWARIELPGGLSGWVEPESMERI